MGRVLVRKNFVAQEAQEMTAFPVPLVLLVFLPYPFRQRIVMISRKLSFAVVGAGMGGLAVAATLRQIGVEVQVYEQAHQFTRIGAGIQMMPNSMKVLRGIGVEERLRRTAFQPYSHLNREGYSGKVMRELPMPESLFGAPYLCMHRADLHDALLSALPKDIVHLNKKLVGIDQQPGKVALTFADGTSVRSDAVI